jgi:ATP-binding cassette subfamily A (ABC1) protein 2
MTSGNQTKFTADHDKTHSSETGSMHNLRTNSSLYLQQFFAILVKRFYYIHRNWRGLFSQILLPALFVCVAMTVALTAPQVQDLPPIILSPAQYYNYTQPRGNFIPTSVASESAAAAWSKDASASDIMATFHLASGVGATCVLKSPFNSSFDADILRSLNFTSHSLQLLEQYFESGCDSVFVKGLPMMNFVPPAPVLINPPVVNGTVPTDAVMNNPNQPRYHPDCTCTSDHTGQLCTTAGFDIPSSFQAVTAEYIQDISGDADEQFYLTTQDMYRLHRYGGYSLGLIRKSIPESFGKNGPTQFRKLAVRHMSLVWYDNKGYHSMPVYINALNNAILRANLPKEKGNKAAYGITAINHPMNNTNSQLSLEYIKQGSDVLIAIFVICAMSFVPASFVVFLVYERSIKAKHLQIVSGLNRVIYWLANYVWDMFNYLIPGTCCIIILKVFDIPAYVSSTNFPAVMTLFLLYGWSITPMMYPASFVFNEPSTAYIFLIVINLFIGITCIITSFLLELFQQNSKDLADIHDILKNVFLVFPNYCLGRGLMDIAFNEYHNEFCFKMGMYSDMKSPFEWKLMARNLVAMAVMGFVFFGITLLCEFRFFIKPRHSSSTELDGMGVAEEDDDVAQERRRVLRGSGRHDLLQLRNLSKVYVTRKMGRQLAVDRVCLGIPAGECFGLLGVNGAGKTTTFRMLTGDLLPSDGDAALDGHSIVKDIFSVQRRIGYCPQFDALYDELTAREHLQLYSRLRGIPPREQKQVVDCALEKVGLSQYADKTSGTYSGGNKRKLSTAIALLGNPPVVFLDEPTTGMDPCSRRFLWNLILDLVYNGTSVILTSHSMEECEVLCNRLAVMVNGRLRCLGSAQHLKNRYGDGYTMLVRVRGTTLDRDIDSIKRFISRRLPNARFKESHHNIIQYEFPSEGLSLSTIFARMEEACRDLQIDDYSISQNTLDNVFINFVKQQQEIIQEFTAGDSVTIPLLSSMPSRSQCGDEDDDEAMLDVLEDEVVSPQWLDTRQMQLTFLHPESSA